MARDLENSAVGRPSSPGFGDGKVPLAIGTSCTARIDPHALARVPMAWKTGVVIEPWVSSLIRKPLLYPSELRGHGAAITLRTAPRQRITHGYSGGRPRALLGTGRLWVMGRLIRNEVVPGRLARRW